MSKYCWREVVPAQAEQASVLSVAKLVYTSKLIVLVVELHEPLLRDGWPELLDVELGPCLHHELLAVRLLTNGRPLDVSAFRKAGQTEVVTVDFRFAKTVDTNAWLVQLDLPTEGADVQH